MNFQPNAWTLLFVLALGGLIWQWSAQETAQLTAPKTEQIQKNDEGCDALEIPAGEFYGYFGDFLTYSSFLKNLFEEAGEACPTFKKEFAKFANVINPEVYRFHVPKCEMRTLIENIPDGDLYAYLTLKEKSATNDSLRIDLIFGNEALVGDDVQGVNASEQSDGGAKFYDFTLPCPDSCNKD